nr:aromatic amino acid lyase [Euzebyales bacterium]
MITIGKHDELTLEVVERVAWGGETLTLDPALLAAVDDSRGRMLAALAGGARVYGVNTGMGYLASQDLDEQAQAAHSANLLLGRAVGGPPYLPGGEARAVLAVRLVNLLSGAAGVTPALCAAVVDRLNDGFLPAIPRESVGSAGDLIPLAHAGQTLMGVGVVLDGHGGVRPAAQALADRGAQPY